MYTFRLDLFHLPHEQSSFGVGVAVDDKTFTLLENLTVNCLGQLDIQRFVFQVTQRFSQSDTIILKLPRDIFIFVNGFSF